MHKCENHSLDPKIHEKYSVWQNESIILVYKVSLQVNPRNLLLNYPSQSNNLDPDSVKVSVFSNKYGGLKSSLVSVSGLYTNI